jgi:hypothetical protein
MRIGYWWESQMERDHLEDQDVGGCNIKMDLLEMGRGGVDWIGLTQNMDKWTGLVKVVMNLRVP